eukprot:m.362954 g.362954  ORF g.362954 m.362954 type:complete len:74 (-) comp21202_c0_seq1:82-303(-)
MQCCGAPLAKSLSDFRRLCFLLFKPMTHCNEWGEGFDCDQPVDIDNARIALLPLDLTSLVPFQNTYKHTRKHA